MTVALSVIGALLVFGLTGAGVWLLCRPTYRYLGNTEPKERRSFRETMAVWLMGRR